MKGEPENESIYGKSSKKDVYNEASVFFIKFLTSIFLCNVEHR